MKWVVASNTNRCCIYAFDSHQKNAHKLEFVKEISHPEFKEKASEYLTTDKPGHYNSPSSSGGAYSPHTDGKIAEIAQFSHEIAIALNAGRNENAYEDLVIISPPHMLGVIHEHLDKHVAAKISKEIHKDVMMLLKDELLGILMEDMK